MNKSRSDTVYVREPGHNKIVGIFLCCFFYHAVGENFINSKLLCTGIFHYKVKFQI